VYRNPMTGKIATPPRAAADRLGYIDWMRGFACVLMFQTHCYDSWLSPEARKSALFAWSQLGGTFPAPLFLFLSGISFALITNRLREKGMARDAIARTTILRGAEIFGLGILFRLQEFLLAYRVAPWTDLLRVDILNMLGLSMICMGVFCRLTANPAIDVARMRGIIGAVAAAGAIALVTPYLWTVDRPHFMPWPIETYFNGVHSFNQPQPWLFPFFPWGAFAFAGLAVGFFLFSNLAKQKEPLLFTVLAGTGILACVLSVFFDRLPIRLYPVYDYWHTSPNFFLMRCGILLVILFLAHAWCCWGWAQRGFSPLMQLGKTSLLVYWVHIEFVYGGMSILPKRKCTVWQATLGLGIIFIAMLFLSLLRTRFKARGKRASSTGPACAAPQAN
jgi:uncharacterized membrane protein